MSVTPSSVIHPKVFISYSHDDDEHMARVLALSDRLRAEGVDCTIDQYEAAPEGGWPRWTQDQIELADFVLIVCTKSYHERFRGREELGKGRGVTWEGAIVTQELYEAQGRNLRIIPTVLTGDNKDYVPIILRGNIVYFLDNEQDYESLYRRLTRQPVTKMPQLGLLRTLPARQRRLPAQRFFCNLPRRRYEFFGRKEETRKLFKSISKDVRQYITLVKGIGGVGKTSLVLEVAHQCWQAITNMVPNDSIPTFEAIIFTSSKATDFTDARLVNRPKKEQTLSDIFREISETLDDPSITQVPKDQQQDQVMKALERQPTLLILDNMETLELSEYESIMAFLENVPAPTQVVITTRTPGTLPSSLVSLEPFEEVDSYQLIDAQAEAKGIELTGQEKSQIHQRCNGIPTMIMYVIGRMAQGHSIKKIASAPLPQDIGRFCFEDMINSLRQPRESRAYYLLMAIAFFCDPPCEDALVKVARFDPSEQDTIDGLTKLQQISFVRKQDDRYIIISTIREYMQEELSRLNIDIQEGMQKRWLQWYLEFTKKYGGDDWADWRERYDKIEEEWRNIESILEFYAHEEKWDEVLSVWEQIDNYVDLNGYWQKRLDWWTKIEQSIGDKATKVKALSEKAWTSILMNPTHHQEAEECLRKAWKDRNRASPIVQADIANHLAVLAKSKKDYLVARDWLQEETKLLLSCKQQSKQEKLRHQAQNLYYRAEVSCLLGEVALAKQEFQETTELCQQIDWKRFSGYAGNGLADILLAERELEAAEALLTDGLSFAKAMREKRRVALFQASFARLNYYRAQKIDPNRPSESVGSQMAAAEKYIQEAMVVFETESMFDEREQATELLREIQSSLLEFLAT